MPGALLLAALLLRVWALDWGLPYVEHPDEPFYVEIVVRMVRDGNPNPMSFWHPTLLFYLMAVVTRLHAWWGVQTGLYGYVEALPIKTYLFTTAPELYVWNRAVSALFGAATVPLLYLLGCRMFDRRTALLGAALLALATFHIDNSHFIATSVPAGLWTTLLLVGAWGVARDGRWRGYLLAGLAAGLAAGTKYNAGIVGLTVVAAHLLFWGRAGLGRPLLRVVASGGLALLVFLLTNPFALLDGERFLADLATQRNAYLVPGGDFVGPWNVAGYARFFLNEGLLPAGCLLALLGLPLLLRRFPRPTLLLLAAIAIKLLLLLAYPTNFVRNLLLIFPLAVLLTAAGAVALADRLPWALARRVALVGMALLLLAPQARDTAWLLGYWSRPYTLVAAADQLRDLPGGMLAAVEMHPVQWAGHPVVTPVRWLASYPLDWYRARGFRYLVANSDNYGGAAREHYTGLLRGAAIVAQYPERREGLQPGPGAALLDLGVHPELIPYVRRDVSFGEVAALLGYELQPGEPRARIMPLEGAAITDLSPGQALQINLYWQALAAMELDYTLFIHVINGDGERVVQRDLPLRHTSYPTSHWQPGEMVIDLADLALPLLPPGEYRLEFGLYDATSGATLPAVGAIDGPGPNPVLTRIAIR